MNSTPAPIHDAGSVKPQKPRYPIAAAVNRFVQQVDSLARSLPLIMAVAQIAEQEAVSKLGNFLEKYGRPVDESDGGKPGRFRVAQEQLQALRPLNKRVEEARAARQTIPRTFVIALVSQFDAYLGNLLRALYEIRPELLRASERSIALSQLAEFGSIEEAKDYLIEKEIESVLRDSHADQFDWLETKFTITLRKDLTVWPLFIEVTERRNLFVHTGGLVSSQDLRVCRDHNVNFKERPFTKVPHVGDELGVSSAYFHAAY